MPPDDDPILFSTVARWVGLGLLIMAGVTYLVHATRGVPTRKRFAAMIDVTLIRTRPVQRFLLAAAAGFGGFLVAGIPATVISLGLVYLFAGSTRTYSEAYEGFGEAMFAVFLAYVGLAIATGIGLAFGIATAFRVWDRLERHSFPHSPAPGSIEPPRSFSP
jgi:hypothetical protein